MNDIPFLDLRSVNLAHQQALTAAFARVIDSGWFILGDEVDAFEREFAAYCGVRHCIGVGNGLEALQMVLRAWGIGPGDEVIVPSNTYIATWLAVSEVGASIVPVEPDPLSYNIDPQRLLAAITSRSKAIIPVHLYGRIADMADLAEIAKPRGIRILEDAAQAHGARYRGRRAGSLGDAAAFSFYPAKNLGALGDGGAVTTDDDALADSLRMLRNYGSREKYHNERRGMNSRLDELHAAFLRVKLPYLDRENAMRAATASVYTHELEGLTELELPTPCPDGDPCWHLYVVRHPRRDALRRRLAELGIHTMIHYPVAPHLQPAYVDRGGSPGLLPISERLHAEVLSLPMWPGMPADTVARVVDALRQACASC